MLSNFGLPKSFRAEAVTTACYLINRSPSSTIEMKSPMETWTGVSPSYDNLRTFGCVDYAHVKQGNLKPGAKSRIFIGYPKDVKGYKLWCVEAGRPKTFFSRDVVFNETQMYKDVKAGEGLEPLAIDDTVQFEVESRRNVNTNQQEEVGENLTQKETTQLDDYHLARDRPRRTMRPP